MKKVFSFSVILIFAAFLLANCNLMKTVDGTGNVKKETREASNFSAIAVHQGIQVHLTQGNTEKVEIETDENLQEHILVKITGDKLTITSDVNIGKSEALNAYVTCKDIHKLSVSSAAAIYGKNEIGGNELDLSASSSGKIEVELDTEDLDCKASSSGQIKIKGNAKSFEGDASSSGDILSDDLTVMTKSELDVSSGSTIVVKGTTNELSISASSGAGIKAKDFKAKTCDANTSSGGYAHITVEEELAVTASSGGRVYYSGNPKITRQKLSSGGTLKQE